MMRFPGKLQNFRMGRSQCRNCSSMSEKDVPMGDWELLVDNMAGLFFKGAFGVVGVVLGGLTSSGAPENSKEEEESIMSMKQSNDERVKKLELMRKNRQERDRQLELLRKNRQERIANFKDI